MRQVSLTSSHLDVAGSGHHATRTSPPDLTTIVSKRTDELDQLRLQLRRKTIALEEVLNTVSQERCNVIRDIQARIQSTVFPLLEVLRDPIPPSHRAVLEQLDFTLREIVLFTTEPSTSGNTSLSFQELRICRMIQRGMGSKAIAQAEAISTQTVETHRRNIRKKLGLAWKKVNLAAYLQSHPL